MSNGQNSANIAKAIDVLVALASAASASQAQAQAVGGLVKTAVAENRDLSDDEWAQIDSANAQSFTDAQGAVDGLSG